MYNDSCWHYLMLLWYCTPGDLSELSSQTEMFASRHCRLVGTRGTSPDPLTSSSRSSSYSSVVSNGSNTSDNSTRNKYLKVAQDSAKKTSGYGSGASGAIGASGGDPKVPGKNNSHWYC